jgi:hypothetical protein
MIINSPGQTVMRIGRVSRPLNVWWVAPTTNTDTLMPNFNTPVMDPDKEAFNTSQNILDDEEPIGIRWIFHYIVIHCGYSFYIL